MAKKKIKKQINKKSNTKLNIHTNLIINSILIVILFFGAIFLLSIANNIDVENKKTLGQYKETSGITYDVTLKPNAFYQTTTLPMNQVYPSQLIDKININFDYLFETSKNTDYKSRYFATATIVINHKDNDENVQDKNLLERTYQLQNEIYINEKNAKEYSLTKSFNIDYNVYNNFVINYMNTYNLNVDAYLKVVLYIQTESSMNAESINVSKSMELNIPLAKNPIEISINNPIDQTGLIEEETNVVTNNIFFIIFAIIMLLTSILLFVQEFKKVLKSDKEQSKYINELNKIIANNNDVIVKIKNKIDLKNSNVIEVETIDALLDVQNELRIPIAYFETKKNKEGNFVIVNGKEIWKYVFKLEDDK